MNVGKEVLIPYIHSIVGGVLPSVSNDANDIREKAIKTNEKLMELIKIDKDKNNVSIDSLLNQVTVQLRSEYVNTRLASLKWVATLHENFHEQLEDHLDKLFSYLLKMLSDPAEEVVTLCLEVMARMANNDEHFTKLMSSLISILHADPILLEKKGSSALRQLSLYIAPEKVSFPLSFPFLSHFSFLLSLPSPFASYFFPSASVPPFPLFLSLSFNIHPLLHFLFL